MRPLPLNGLRQTFIFDENTQMCRYRDGSRSPFPRERLDDEVRILVELSLQNLARALTRSIL